uniref:Uncharacterized protein n=1 Tax=Physcomitrium patens TaxID=3218 RepID=A0A7I3ZIC7_PHYPA
MFSTGDGLNGIPSPPSADTVADEDLDKAADLDKQSLLHSTEVATAATKLKKTGSELEAGGVTDKHSDVEEESTNVGIAQASEYEEQFVEGEENSSVESEQPLIGGDGVAGGGGEAHALLQPGAAAQPGDLPHAAVPPVVDAPNPSQIENMSEASQAQYLWFMKTFPKLEDGADS